VPRTPAAGVARLVEDAEQPGDAEHVVLVGVLQRHRRQVGHRLERRQHLAQQGEAPSSMCTPIRAGASRSPSTSSALPLVSSRS
jgi:hypothetical protein